MFAKDLVGKICIRETPVMKDRYVNGGGFAFGGDRFVRIPDYTYCTTPVKIIAATDHNIVCEEKGVFDGKPRRIILDERFCDEAWVDYDALVGDYKPDTCECGCDCGCRENTEGGNDNE